MSIETNSDAVPSTLAEALEQIASLKCSVAYYIRDAEKSAAQAQEQLARRLALEEELDATEDSWLSREPLIRFVERKVTKPMPARIEVRKISTSRTVRIIEVIERPAGPFGRLGDRIDRLFR